MSGRGSAGARPPTAMRLSGSGQPLCPRCAAPMDDTGHSCIRTNGHSKQPIPPDRIEDTEDESN